MNPFELPNSRHLAPIRLKLAQILLQFHDQPRQALAVLRKLPSPLSEQQQSLRQALLGRIKAALQHGSLEAEVQDW
jgi:hypothetical protein